MEDIGNGDESESALEGAGSLDSVMINSLSTEKTGHDTQKPMSLLRRIITVSSSPGDVVSDCSAGSGTTPVVAEVLGRRWVAVDTGRLAVHTPASDCRSSPGCRTLHRRRPRSARAAGVAAGDDRRAGAGPTSTTSSVSTRRRRSLVRRTSTAPVGPAPSTSPPSTRRCHPAAEPSLFSAQPCDNGSEVQLVGFLDRAQDVESFAELARDVGFSLEPGPRTADSRTTTPISWCGCATGVTSSSRPTAAPTLTSRTRTVVPCSGPRTRRRLRVAWSYLRVDQEGVDQRAGGLRSLGELADLVREVRRQEDLRSRPTPRRETREEVLAVMERARRTSPRFDVEREVRSPRDGRHG